MSVAGFLTGQAGVGRGLSLGPSTGAADAVTSAFDYTWKAHTTAAAIQYQGQPLNERNDLIKQRFNQDIHDITRTRKKYTNPSADGRVKMQNEANDAIDEWILRGRAEAPDKYKGIKTTREIREEARASLDMSEKHMAEVMARNPSGLSRMTGGFIGAAGAAILDPVNLATLPLGTGPVQGGLKGWKAARAVLKAAAIDGTINAAVEGVSQPAIMAWQKEMGRRYGFGDAAGNVALAFVGGAGLSGLIRGGVRGIKGASDYVGSVSADMLDRIAASEKLPASVRDAAAFMSRQAHIDESAPPGLIKTGEDLKLHRDTAQRVADDFENYRPAALSSSGSNERPVNMTSATDAPGAQALPSQISEDIPPSSFSRTRATTPPSKTTGEGSISIDASISKLYHRVDDLATIKKLAKQLAPELEGFIKNIAERVEGAKVYGVRLKETSSLKAKISRGKSPQQVSDYLGGRIVVDTPQAMGAIVTSLRRNSEIFQIDDMLAGNRSGYRAIHVQVMSNKGVSAEIQLQPKEIRAAQEKAHKIYKKWQGVEITAKNRAAYEKDYLAQKKLFDDAWSEWRERTGGQGAVDDFNDVKPPERMEELDLPEGLAPEVSADRVAIAESDLKALTDDLGDEVIALDDGRTLSIREFSMEIQGKKNLIEAMKTCRIA